MNELDFKLKTIREVCRRNNTFDWISGTSTPHVLSIDEIALDWQDRMIKGMSTWTLFEETIKYVSVCYYNDLLTTPKYKSIIGVYENKFGVCKSADESYELSVKLLKDIGYA